MYSAAENGVRYQFGGNGDESTDTVEDVDVCEKACRSDALCTAFTFSPEGTGSSGLCWIWNQGGLKPDGTNKATCYVRNYDA